jgi:CrcB protein
MSVYFLTIPLITPKTNFISMKGLEFIFLGMGSVLGAFLRYKLTESPLIFNTLPVNVLIVNIAGAFILGVFVVVSQQWHLDSKYSLFAAVGFCGSLTTMSAFALDSSNLLESNQYISFIVNIFTNVGLSIAALIGGKSLMTAIINN